VLVPIWDKDLATSFFTSHLNTWRHPGAAMGLLLSQTGTDRDCLSGLMEFTTDVTPARRMRESLTGRVRASSGNFGHTKYQRRPIFPASGVNGFYTQTIGATIPPTLEGLFVQRFSELLRMVRRPYSTRWRVRLSAQVGRAGSLTLRVLSIMTNASGTTARPTLALLGPPITPGRRPCLLAAQPEPDAESVSPLCAFPQRARDHHDDVFPGGHADE